MKCKLCNTEIEQGKNGYEIGIIKWHKKIHPFPFIGLICEKHYKELVKHLGVSEAEEKLIHQQQN